MVRKSTKWFAQNYPKVLDVSFYERNTLNVARDLIGKLLTVEDEAGRVTGRIVETEGYHGEDPASHSARGLTPRCAPMFEAPGRAYVYFIYGMYEMLNFVTEPAGRAGAVLVRAMEPVEGDVLIASRRSGALKKNWTNGPGKLTRALAISMSDNRAKLDGKRIRVSDDGYSVSKMVCSPRVGIREAKDKYWRYFEEGSLYVSPVKENKLARSVRIKSKN